MVLCCATVHANKATTESVLVLTDVDREMSSKHTGFTRCNL